MTQIRDVSTPTSISLCLSGNYILIKDLAGKSYIFSKEDKEAGWAKVIELASDEKLPFTDVGHVSVNDEQSTTSLSDLDLEDLDPENIRKIVFQQGISWLKNMTTYPRGKSVPTTNKKKTGK